MVDYHSYSSNSANSSTIWITWTSDPGTTASTSTVWTAWCWTTGAYELKQKKEALAREQARKVAEQLLLSILTRSEREEYRANKSVTVLSGGSRYRVRMGRAGNIDRLTDDGKVVERLCCHIRDNVPDADNVAAQILYLKHNPTEFLALANRTRVQQ
jgi:hypothetical protein